MEEKRTKGEPFALDEWREVAGQFRRVFRKDFQDFYDKTLSLLVFRQWKIDIVRFDEWLRLRHKDCGEYRKHLHYEDVWGNARCVGMPESMDSNEFGKTAEEYIRYVVSDLRKSSRWFGFTRQRLMLMDKALTPFGFFRDVICKNGKVEVEYFTCGEDDYFDLLFDAEPTEGCIKTCEFCRLSPVSMKHLVHLIGYGSGDDEDVREDYRHILCHEVWDDIVGVRVPYRIVDGKRVTTERIHDDAEMLEVARRKGIDHEVADCWFWEHTCPAEKIRELVY